MRALILLLLVGFSRIYAQHSSPAPSNLNRNISIKISNQPLSQVLSKISSAGNFYFSYSGNVLKSDSSVSLSAQNRTVKKVLDELFQGQVQYKETGKYVILKSVRYRFKVVPQNIITTDHSYEIDGFVYDETTGEKVVNASVYERHLIKSTLTNEEGYFNFHFKDKVDGVLLTVSKESYRDTSIQFLSNVTVTPEGRNSLGDTFEGALNTVERLRLGRLLVASKQRIQSLNIPSVLANAPFQASLWPGLSSHGIMSSQVVNKGSLNVLGGYTAGVDGVEIGGLFNINKKDVKKIQAAGLMNIVGGSVQGVQAAGLFNLVIDSVKGVQAAGLVNAVRDRVYGVQAGGLINIAKGEIKGGQYAGLVNASGGKLTGMQAAGLMNINVKNLQGTQASGLLSLNLKEVDGCQASGLLNIGLNSVEGGQVSGLGNIAFKELKGIQISGLLNFAKRMHGTQIGIINLADTSSGYSIGLFNLVRKGYHKVSLFSNETLNTEMRIKTGNSKMYSMLIGGANFSKSAKIYSLGLGLGHDFLMSGKLSIATELSSQWLYLGNKDQTNVLNRAQGLFQYKVAKLLSLFAGPAYTVYYSDPDNLPKKGFAARIGPTSQKYISKNTKGWLGWSLGLTLM